MAFQRKRSRPINRRLDPRLSFLLSIPVKQLKLLKQQEDDRVVQRFDRADDKHREAKPTRFGPITTGIYFPSKGEKEGPAKLKELYASVFILSDASAKDLVRLGAQI